MSSEILTLPLPALPASPAAAPADMVAIMAQAIAQAMAAALPAAMAAAAPAAVHQAPAAPAVPAPAAANGRPSMTLIELVNEFLMSKARGGRSDRYLRQLRVSLTSFANGRARTPLPLITADMIESWQESNGWVARTKNGYASDVRTMLNYAVNRGYIAHNVAKAVERCADELKDEEVAIHTPEQVIKILQYARYADLDVMRLLAVRYFAGVRSSETHLLTEAMIKLEHGLIEVPARVAKTRSRRLVTISENLKAWLALGGTIGPIGDMRIRAVIKGSKVECPHNVARHSFCSYHVAQHKKASETALEAGNSEAMIFKHYRALVTPAAAAAYWSILPKRNHNK